MDISIIGAGYVGLGTALGFSGNGHKVRCIDKNEFVIDLINRGISPVYEKGMDDLLATYVNGKNSLSGFVDYDEILATDITFICVGTPSDPNGGIDLSHVENAVRELGEMLHRKDDYHVVVVKSTVIPGTTIERIIPLLEGVSGKRAGHEFGVVVNPEFLEEGRILHCSVNPYRIIIGASDQRSGDIVAEVYRHLSAPILRTDITTAEMIKYASNAFLATKITFINEIGNICKRMGVDVQEVARGMGYDPRIGEKFLNAGVGFGGSCLPKDLEALICKAAELGYKAGLLDSVMKLNREQALKLVEIARDKLGGLRNKVVAVLGLAFKPNTDDIRESPALIIISRLLEEGARVKVYDPRAMPAMRGVVGDTVEFCGSVIEAVGEADGVLIVTEWDEFRDENLYRGRTVIDGRRALDPDMARKTCDYEGICW